MKENNDYIVYINNLENNYRQRFSICHEIAHYLYDKNILDKNGCLYRNKEFKTNIERNADKVASEILMPEEFIKEYCYKYNESEIEVEPRVIVNLSDKLQTSIIATAIRLKELNFYVRSEFLI